jgi:hypothetical protein
VLIDCDTCTVRGQGCDDCVVTVLLGAPPGWQGHDPSVVPLTRRPDVVTERPDAPPAAAPAVVELDDVEHRAVRALADFGLVPPLRHQDASTTRQGSGERGNRHVS